MSDFGVLFYLFAGRARPIILDFTEETDPSPNRKDTTKEEGAGEYDNDVFDEAPPEGADDNKGKSNEAENDLNGANKLSQPLPPRPPSSPNRNKHNSSESCTFRYTDTIPKIPVMKAPRTIQSRLTKNDADANNTSFSLSMAASNNNGAISTTVVADETMRTLQKVILADVVRRASENNTSFDESDEHEDVHRSGLPREIIDAMAGKDITILAMAASRDCRAKAYRTAASQQKVNPHKKPSSDSQDAHPLSTRGNNKSVSMNLSHVGAVRTGTVMQPSTISRKSTESFSRGFIADGYIPEYMRSLRRVIVSSNTKITTHGYKPAYTTMNASMTIANRSAYSAASLANANISVSNFGVSGNGGVHTSALRQRFGADSGVFAGASSLIDPSNPNLMLCGSFESLLRQVSPFCFCTLEEIHFKIRPSAAKGQHGATERGLKSGDKTMSSLAASITIPPMLLFAAANANGFGTCGSASTGVKGNKTVSINANDLDPDAVTVRGYPILMNQQDAFSLYSFIHYSPQATSQHTKTSPGKKSPARVANGGDKLLSPSRPLSGIGGTESGASIAESNLRKDESVPFHPRDLISAEVHLANKNNGSDGSDWFGARPICPLQLHMEWLSGTRLWVPHEKQKKKTSKAQMSPARDQNASQNTTQKMSPSRHQELPPAIPCPQEDIYNENPIGPLAPIMNPPPPLTFATSTVVNTDGGKRGVKVLASPLRRKGQELLLTANCAIPIKSGTASSKGGSQVASARGASKSGLVSPTSKMEPAPVTTNGEGADVSVAATVASDQPAACQGTGADSISPPVLVTEQVAVAPEETAVQTTAITNGTTAPVVPPLALGDLNTKPTSPRPNTANNGSPKREGALAVRPPTAPPSSKRILSNHNNFSIPSSHPLLKLLMQQRIQDHLDYLSTQEECYRRQVLWRAQLEARQILLLSFVKEFDERTEVAGQLNDVLFVQKKVHAVANASLRREAKTNERQRKALIGPSPLVQRLRGMLQQ